MSRKEFSTQEKPSYGEPVKKLVIRTAQSTLITQAKRIFIRKAADLENTTSYEFENVELTGDDQKHENSAFGLPVWSSLTFPAGSYETLDGEVIEFEGLELLSVLMSVNQSKTIIKTAIQGRPGTVKEYISDGDYSISINGALFGESQDIYPEDQLIELLEVLKAPVAIKVESEFLSYFDIDEIVIENYDCDQKKGSRNAQPFKITALSDTPIELRNTGEI